MNKDITKELRVCKNPRCRKEYQATIVNLMGARLIRGEGFCPRCAEEQYQREVRDATMPG